MLVHQDLEVACVKELNLVVEDFGLCLEHDFDLVALLVDSIISSQKS